MADTTTGCPFFWAPHLAARVDRKLGLRNSRAAKFRFVDKKFYAVLLDDEKSRRPLDDGRLDKIEDRRTSPTHPWNPYWD